MTQETHVSTPEEFPDAVRVYLSDAIGNSEEFRCGVVTEGGLFRSGPAIAVTSDRILIVRSGLVDTRGRVVSPEDVEAFRFEQTDDALVRFEIVLESTAIEFTIREFPDRFADRLAELFGGVPVRVDLPEHRSERRTDPRERAERAVAAADDAREDGNVETAIAELETAIDRYKRADGDDVADAIELVGERVESLRRLEAVRAELRADLAEVERAFHTAVAAHANGKRTLARIRYRQARDGYAAAAATVDDAPVDALVGGLEVTVTFDGDPPPERLSELRPPGDATVTASVSDVVGDDMAALRDGSTGDLARLHRDASLRGGLGGLLLLLAVWNGEGTRRFEDRSAIEYRERLAAVGFASCQ
ncbi:hypothetical protein [Halorubrum sp. DTA98]|uniref:hypothetical protein n=1 Tax=Halorubrum sp. DTA98 TaxID=3402163 RepID=UPI003AAF802B